MTKFVRSFALVMGTAALLLSSCAVDDLQADIDALGDRVDGLEAGSIATLEEQYASLAAALEKLESELDATDAEHAAAISALESEAAALKTELAAKADQADLDALASDLQTVESDLLAAIAEKADQSDLEDVQDDIDAINALIDGIEEDITALEKADVAMDARLDLLESWQTTVNASISALESADALTAKEIADIKATLEAYGTAIDGLETSLAEAVEDIQGQIDTLNDENDDRKAEIADLRSDMEAEDAALLALIETNEDAIEANELQISILNMLLSDLETTVADNYDEVTKAIASLNTSLNQLWAILDQYALASDLEAVKTQVTTNTANIATAMADIVDLQTRMIAVEAQTAQLAIDYALLDAEVLALQQALTNYVTNDSLTQTLSNYATVVDLTTAISNFEATVADLKTSIAANGSAIDGLDSRLDAYDSLFGDDVKATIEGWCGSLLIEVFSMYSDPEAREASAEWTAFEDAVNALIWEAAFNEGGVLYSTLETVNARLDTLESAVEKLQEQVGDLEEDVKDLQGQITNFMNQVQSITYVPEYVDGMITAEVYALYSPVYLTNYMNDNLDTDVVISDYYAIADNMTATATYSIRPASALEGMTEEALMSILSVNSTTVKVTRSDDGVVAPAITGVVVDEVAGTIDVSYSLPTTCMANNIIAYAVAAAYFEQANISYGTFLAMWSMMKDDIDELEEYVAPEVDELLSIALEIADSETNTYISSDFVHVAEMPAEAGAIEVDLYEKVDDVLVQVSYTPTSRHFYEIEYTSSERVVWAEGINGYYVIDGAPLTADQVAATYGIDVDGVTKVSERTDYNTKGEVAITLKEDTSKVYITEGQDDNGDNYVGNSNYIGAMIKGNANYTFDSGIVVPYRCKTDIINTTYESTINIETPVLWSYDIASSRTASDRKSFSFVVPNEDAVSEDGNFISDRNLTKYPITSGELLMQGSVVSTSVSSIKITDAEENVLMDFVYELPNDKPWASFMYDANRDVIVTITNTGDYFYNTFFPAEDCTVEIGILFDNNADANSDKRANEDVTITLTTKALPAETTITYDGIAFTYNVASPADMTVTKDFYVDMSAAYGAYFSDVEDIYTTLIATDAAVETTPAATDYTVTTPTASSMSLGYVAATDAAAAKFNVDFILDVDDYTATDDTFDFTCKSNIALANPALPYPVSVTVGTGTSASVTNPFTAYTIERNPVVFGTATVESGNYVAYVPGYYYTDSGDQYYDLASPYLFDCKGANLDMYFSVKDGSGTTLSTGLDFDFAFTSNTEYIYAYSTFDATNNTFDFRSPGNEVVTLETVKVNGIEIVGMPALPTATNNASGAFEIGMKDSDLPIQIAEFHDTYKGVIIEEFTFGDTQTTVVNVTDYVDLLDRRGIDVFSGNAVTYGMWARNTANFAQSADLVYSSLEVTFGPAKCYFYYDLDGDSKNDQVVAQQFAGLVTLDETTGNLTFDELLSTSSQLDLYIDVPVVVKDYWTAETTTTLKVKINKN